LRQGFIANHRWLCSWRNLHSCLGEEPPRTRRSRCLIPVSGSEDSEPTTYTIDVISCPQTGTSASGVGSWCMENVPDRVVAAFSVFAFDIDGTVMSEEPACDPVSTPPFPLLIVG
jgi:hypothetical protein